MYFKYPDMTKSVVAIVSVLKTVADTRNHEKIATSISNTNKYEINIIGFWTKKLPVQENITFHPLRRFNRLSVKRLRVQVDILKLLLKLKPELVIVTCAELLAVICLYRIIFGGKIIYDIQENYYRNIIYTNTYPALIRYPIAAIVRLMEYLCSPMVNMFFLAEKIYTQQLKFIGTKYKIIENKAVIPENFPDNLMKSNHKITFLYTGTIAEHYGIFEAIRFIDRLYQVHQNIELRIVGFAPDEKVLLKTRGQTKSKDYIKFSGGDVFVPHIQILKEIRLCNFCLMPYRRNKATEGRIPTKLFECLVLETPVIISPDPIWETMMRKNNAGFIWDFMDSDVPAQDLLRQRFYGKNLSWQYRWNAESVLVAKAVDQLIYGSLK